MKPDDLYQLLRLTGYPVTFHHFDQPPPLPYLVYLTPYTVNWYADNSVYVKGSHWQVELYTEKKNIAVERKVEDELTAFCWEKTQDYIPEEKLYRTMYEFEDLDD